MSVRKVHVFDDREYTWEGNFGATLKSREFGRENGDVRFLGGFFWVVYKVVDKRLFGAPTVWWALAEKSPSAERIREVGKELETLI